MASSAGNDTSAASWRTKKAALLDSLVEGRGL